MRKLTFVFLLLAGPAMAQQPAEFKVPAELAQATVDYLATRPYKEVAPIIAQWLRIAQQTQQEKKE